MIVAGYFAGSVALGIVVAWIRYSHSPFLAPASAIRIRE
jgi:hypothetical protein